MAAENKYITYSEENAFVIDYSGSTNGLDDALNNSKAIFCCFSAESSYITIGDNEYTFRSDEGDEFGGVRFYIPYFGTYTRQITGGYVTSTVFKTLVYARNLTDSFDSIYELGVSHNVGPTQGRQSWSIGMTQATTCASPSSIEALFDFSNRIITEIGS